MKKFYWSLDISTTNIGSALWDENGNLVELKHLELKNNKEISKENRDIYKAQIFKDYCIDYKKKIETQYNGIINKVIVEEPLGGSNNQNTVSLLFGFNGMARYVLYDVFGYYPIKISVYESRKGFCRELVRPKKERGVIKEVLSFPDAYKKEKKQYIWEKVNKKEPNVEWFYKKNGNLHTKSYDMSDAYACGYAVLRNLGIIEK